MVTVPIFTKFRYQYMDSADQQRNVARSPQLSHLDSVDQTNWNTRNCNTRKDMSNNLKTCQGKHGFDYCQIRFPYLRDAGCSGNDEAGKCYQAELDVCQGNRIPKLHQDLLSNVIGEGRTAIPHQTEYDKLEVVRKRDMKLP
jgi:hypothetical protein